MTVALLQLPMLNAKGNDHVSQPCHNFDTSLRSAVVSMRVIRLAVAQHCVLE
jgi:hypothetical protein